MGYKVKVGRGTNCGLIRTEMLTVILPSLEYLRVRMSVFKRNKAQHIHNAKVLSDKLGRVWNPVYFRGGMKQNPLHGNKKKKHKKEPPPTSTLYCSFCGKNQFEVRKMIAATSVFICDECVELCNDVIAEG